MVKRKSNIGRNPRRYQKNKEIRRQKYRQAVTDKAAALVADLVIQAWSLTQYLYFPTLYSFQKQGDTLKIQLRTKHAQEGPKDDRPVP